MDKEQTTEQTSSETFADEFDYDVSSDVMDFLSEVEETKTEEVAEEPEKEETEEEAEASAEDTEEPVEEEAESEAPKEEAEVEAEAEAESESESEDDEVDEVNKLRDQVNNLTAIINQLSMGQKPQVPVQEQKKEETGKTEVKPEDAAQVAAQAAAQTSPADFKELFKDFDFDKVIDTQEGFVDFMSKFAEAIYGNTINTVSSGVPELVTQSISQREAFGQLHNAFYESYPELSNVKGYVGQVASEICNANPELEVYQVLEMTADTVRNNLGLTAEAVNTAKGETPKKSPALPGSKGTRQPTKPVSGVQAEIDDLLSGDF